MNSLLGVHALAKGGHTSQYVREMVEHGYHVPVVLTVNTPQLSWEVKQASPKTVTITRLTYESLKLIGYGFEFSWFNPKAQARWLWGDHFGQANVLTEQLRMDTYWLLMNEHDPPPDVLSEGYDQFRGYRNQALMCMELNEIAKAHGMKLAHMGLNAGTPDYQEYEVMAQTGLFQQMQAYGSLMVFHEGVFGDATPVDAGWPQDGSFDSGFTDEDRHKSVNLAGLRRSPAPWGNAKPGNTQFRYRVLYEGFLKPAGIVLPAAIGEFYAGGGHQQDHPGRSAEGDQFVRGVMGRMRWYNDEASKDEYLIGVCPFTVGSSDSEWPNSNYDFLYDPQYYEEGGGKSAALVFAETIEHVPSPRHIEPTGPAGVAAPVPPEKEIIMPKWIMLPDCPDAEFASIVASIEARGYKARPSDGLTRIEKVNTFKVKMLQAFTLFSGVGYDKLRLTGVKVATDQVLDVAEVVRQSVYPFTDWFRIVSPGGWLPYDEQWVVKL